MLNGVADRRERALCGKLSHPIIQYEFTAKNIKLGRANKKNKQIAIKQTSNQSINQTNIDREQRT